MAKTVLVLDDDPILLRSIVDALQQAGYHTLQAADGKTGLAFALEKQPDMILSDNLMPHMNGVEMMAQLRKDKWGARVPLLLMTNMYDVNAVNQSLQAGVTEHIMKSDVTLAKLVGMVQAKIGNA